MVSSTQSAHYLDLRSKTSEVKNFLEVGCGTGFVISGIAKAFPAFELEASEYFGEGLVFTEASPMPFSPA